MAVVRRRRQAGERLARASRPPTNRNMGGGSAMPPGNYLAVDGLPTLLDGGCSLVPACLHLSLVASAHVVGPQHWDENLANWVLCAKCTILARF